MTEHPRSPGQPCHPGVAGVSPAASWIVRVLVLSAATLSAAAAGYRDGPPPAHTGGFGDDTCHACHFDSDLNDASGSLTLDGVPLSFESLEPYRLTITLARPGLAVAGFQLAVRIADGPRRGRQAGTLRAVDDRVHIVTDGNGDVVYAQHTDTGAAVTESGTWSVEWSPGSVEAPVVFHVAANASNDDFSEFGDYIYTLESTSVPTQGP